jgi:hypothetical protein
MKKIILSIVSILSIANLYSQTSGSVKAKKDSVYIVSEKDDMEDKVYYYPSQKISIIDNDTKTGLTISAFIDNENGDLLLGDLKVKSVGIGSCTERDELILLLEDDTKIKLVSWNSFNCKGDSWFTVNNSDAEILATKKVKKIKFINGRTFESLTRELPVDKQAYFCELYYALKTKKVRAK